MFLKLFENFIESINESVRLNPHIQQLKNYLTKTFEQKEKEFKELFPTKNYDGTPTPEDIKISLHDTTFKTIRPDTKGRKKVVNRNYPSHYYFTYLNDVPNRWLIHFTNSGSSIFKDNSFKLGISDYKKIGYTNRQSKSGKREGGYNFGYLFSDAINYGLLKNPNALISVDNEEPAKNKSHYGTEIIIFKASGIKVKTWLNDERQVVFWGAEAKHLNLITNVKGKWCIKTRKQKINKDFFKSFWEQYIKPYNKQHILFNEKLLDFENLFQFDNLKDVFKFFENDYDKYKKYLN